MVRARLLWVVCMFGMMTACSADAPKAATGKRPPAPVTVAVVAKADVPIAIEAIGHVQASQIVAVSSRVGGQLVEVHFTEGALVTAGQLLFTIDPRPYQIALDAARARLARDQALYRAAGRNLARQDALGETNLTSKAELDTASTTVSASRATIAADQADVANAELQLAYCAITSPISGRTGELMIHAGNLVRANDTQPLVTIRQTDPVRVAISLPERYLPRLRQRVDADPLTLEATPVGDAARTSRGTLALVDNTVDATTGTIAVFGTFKNPDGNLWPGQYVQAKIRLAVDKDQIVVPARAVQDSQKGHFVYVVEGQKAKLQPIEVTRIQDDIAIIQSGLTVGEVVVTDGQMRLKPGAEVAITPTKDARADTPVPTRAMP